MKTVTPSTAKKLIAILARVYESEQAHDEDSIYWPEERDEWKRVLDRARREMTRP